MPEAATWDSATRLWQCNGVTTKRRHFAINCRKDCSGVLLNRLQHRREVNIIGKLKYADNNQLSLTKGVTR